MFMFTKKILPVVTLAIIVAFTMVTLVPATFAKGNGNKSNMNSDGNTLSQSIGAKINSSGVKSNGNAYGHFIAPGWLKKHNQPTTEGIILPLGIAKKFNQGGGPGHHDIVAPTISSIDVIDTDTTATIAWNTDEPTKSTVYISTSSPFDLDDINTMKVVDTNFEISHEAHFIGLVPSTMYYVRIKVVDQSGNIRMSNEFSFTTDVEPDIVGPIISGIVQTTGTTTATTTWHTNESATSVGYLSTTTGFGILDPMVSKILNLNLVNDHTISFIGLTASTTYYMRVESTDASANTTLSNEMSFTTL